LAAIAKRLGNMDAADLLGAGEVGDRAGDAQDAVEAAGRQAHCGSSVGEKLAAGVVGRRDLIEEFAIGFGISARTVTVEAFRLDLAGSGDAAGDFGTTFGWWREGQVRGGYAGDFDVEVDAIE